MKIIKIERANEQRNFDEITISENYIFFKIETTYRNFNGTILKYTYPDNYSELGFSESHRISKLFNIKQLDESTTN